MSGEDIRPPIPVTCAARPTIGGLVVPVVNVPLADGGVDFRSRHQAKFAECWQQALCQVCGGRITGRAVLLAGAHHVASGHIDEAPLCAPCAVYTTRACPMVAGRMERFADRPRVSEGKRGHVCFEEGCDCGGWTGVDPDAEGTTGQTAHAWYALYVRPGAWQVTGNVVRTRCSDLGCEHDRLVVNGGMLTVPPLKVVLVSSPEQGRVWRTLDAAEVAALMTTEAASVMTPDSPEDSQAGSTPPPGLGADGALVEPASPAPARPAPDGSVDPRPPVRGTTGPSPSPGGDGPAPSSPLLPLREGDGDGGAREEAPGMLRPAGTSPAQDAPGAVSPPAAAPGGSSGQEWRDRVKAATSAVHAAQRNERGRYTRKTPGQRFGPGMARRMPEPPPEDAA